MDLEYERERRLKHLVYCVNDWVKDPQMMIQQEGSIYSLRGGIATTHLLLYVLIRPPKLIFSRTLIDATNPGTVDPQDFHKGQEKGLGIAIEKCGIKTKPAANDLLCRRVPPEIVLHLTI